MNPHRLHQMDSASNYAASSRSHVSFDDFPAEILLSIFTSLCSLDLLWTLLRASPRAWRLFHNHSLHIVEGILSGPQSFIPPETQGLIRGVVLLRAQIVPFGSLEDFQIGFLRGVIHLRPKSSNIVLLGPDRLSTAHITPGVLRSVVATSAHLVALSQSCLASALEHIRDPAFQPLNCSEKKPYFGLRHSEAPRLRKDYHIKPWDREFSSTKVEVVDAGQPSWVEEMRALRAMWTLQQLGELQKLAVEARDSLEWSDLDVASLGDLTPENMFALPSYSSLVGEEVRSASYFLKTLRSPKESEYFRLPSPPTATETNRWITALPKRTILERWLSKGSVKVPRYNDDYNFGQTEVALQNRAPCVVPFEAISLSYDSPVRGIAFDSLRPLGFIFWDVKRLYLMGLQDKRGRARRSREFYMFAWESILPAEEVRATKAELRRKESEDTSA